jgi:Ferritin-like
MIKLQWKEPTGLGDVQALVQTAIDLEFATLPPYLYAKFSIRPESNAPALARLDAIVGQEMIHMCLACNILNAIGGTAAITPPRYPGPLPGDVVGGLVINLLPFSPDAVAQGMAIEEPAEPVQPMLESAAVDEPVTIGEYYARVDAALKALPASAWQPGRNQIGDSQFFAGQLFAVNNYDDAHQAISNIVSEGEGTPMTPGEKGSPLDFQNELAHYYRFWEIHRGLVLAKADNAVGWTWGGPLDVDYTSVYPAIANPQRHDFARDSAQAQAAQLACNTAFTAMVDALSKAFAGADGGLGIAVRAMFDLRMATTKALTTPLADGVSVAGPAFVYLDHAPVEGGAA